MAWRRRLISIVSALVLAGPVAAAARLPPLTAIEPVDAGYGSTRIAAATPDGRAATIVRTRRENGNAHGYDVVFVLVDAPAAAHVAATPGIVAIEQPDHRLADDIRVATFDGEADIGAVRLVRARIGGAPATLLLEARRHTGPVLTDAAPVELRVRRLDGPDDGVGRTPYLFRLIGATMTGRRYCSAGAALTREFGLAAPDGDSTPDGCPSAFAQTQKAAAAAMLRTLDMTSFPSSIGPRRRPGARTLADYGFTGFTAFDDGWAEARMPDGSWSFRFFVLDDGARAKRLCIVDAAVGGGTYHTTEAIDVAPGGDGLWHATRVVGSVPGCA